MIKPTPRNLEKIEQVFKNNQYLIRYEKGQFNSGYCILKDKKVVVVNKFYDTEARINCLIDILKVVYQEETWPMGDLSDMVQGLSIQKEN